MQHKIWLRSSFGNLNVLIIIYILVQMAVMGTGTVIPSKNNKKTNQVKAALKSY